MSAPRRHAIRGLLFIIGSVMALVVPGGGAIPLVAALALVVHDGPATPGVRRIAAWLIALELLSGSAVGTLALPFCIICLALAGIQRVLAVNPWAQRTGWSPTDAARASLTSIAAAAGGIMLWAGMTALSGTLGMSGRVVALLPLAPAVIAWAVGAVLMARFSTEPFSRPIIFGGT